MPAPRTVHRGGSRFYIHPDRGREHPGVTSIIDMKGKPFLPSWAAKLSAELAVDTLATPEGRRFFAGMVERDRAGAIDYLKGASRRYTKTRSEVGSKAHDLFERMLRAWDGTASSVAGFEHVDPDVVDHRDHFVQFLADVNPDLVRAEDVVWSDTHGYAGSFDAILNVWLAPDGTPTADRSGTRRSLIVDWKTGARTYAEVAMQLAAYAFADCLLDSDGVEHPVPQIDGAAVLHITDTAWEFEPVLGGMRTHFDAFLSLRNVFTWDRDIAPNAIGRPIAGSGRLITGTERRA